MGGFFYNLGRLAGPTVRKGKWVWQSLTGTDEAIVKAEHEVGRDLARAFHAELPADPDPELHALVGELAGALAARVKNKHRTFTVSVVRAEAPNAFALPGGFIFATRSLLDLVGRSRDELAFILGHEMGHVIRQDPMQRVVSDTTIGTALRALPGAGAAGVWLRSVAAQLLQSSYSQDRELGADELGLRLARAAGFDPAGALRMLKRFEEIAASREDDDGPLAPYFSTHPPVAVRVRELNRFLTAGRSAR
jgi:predicted Zn-dependent protease